MTFAVYSKFNVNYFPWLFPEDNPEKVCATEETFAQAVEWIQTNGTAAFNYSIGELRD